METVETRIEPNCFSLRCVCNEKSIALLEEELKFIKQKTAIIESQSKKKHIRKTLVEHQTPEFYLKFIPSISNIEKLRGLLEIEYEGLFDVKITSHKTIVFDGDEYIIPKDALFMGH